VYYKAVVDRDAQYGTTVPRFGRRGSLMDLFVIAGPNGLEDVVGEIGASQRVM